MTFPRDVKFNKISFTPTNFLFLFFRFAFVKVMKRENFKIPSIITFIGFIILIIERKERKREGRK